MSGSVVGSTRSQPLFWLGCIALAFGALSAALFPAESFGERAAEVGAEHRLPDPAQVVGADACAECHGNEHEVWMRTAHQSDAMALTRDPEAKRIAKVLGVRRIKADERCVSCHYTTRANESGKLKSISGVSCESCHSPAAGWIDPHSQFGIEADSAENETTQHRVDRLAYCDSMGMVRPGKLYAMGAACYRCHWITDQELVETAGHPSGDSFEFASWSQGSIRHNFLRSGSDQNPRSDAQRVRVMFLVGAALRLEFACDAREHGAPNGSITGAVSALRAIAEVVSIQSVDELVEIGASVQGSTDAAAIASAKARVRTIAQALAEESIGADVAALDALIPEPWGEPGAGVGR